MTTRFSFTNMFHKKQHEEQVQAGPQKKSSLLGKPQNKPVRAVVLDNFKKIKLHDNFAQEILENDILFETEANPNVNVAQKLTQLYMLGVEYYSSIQDSVRMQYFQNKLTTLMASPKFFQTQQESKQKEIIEQARHAADDVKEVLSSMKSNVEKIDGIVQHEIATQEDHLKKRLEERRNKSLQRTMGRASSQPVIEKVQQEPRQQLQMQQQFDEEIQNKDRTKTKERLALEKKSLEDRVNRFQKREKRGSLLQDHFLLFVGRKTTESRSAPIL